GQVRVCEYAQSKISRMMEMIRLAIVQGIRFDYLLVDSWFTCSSLGFETDFSVLSKNSRFERSSLLLFHVL
ncbi:hypothetical protein EZS27_029361, partial [termite gut metagenome]